MGLRIKLITVLLFLAYALTLGVVVSPGEPSGMRNISVSAAFYSSGWMGDIDAIKYTDGWIGNPHSGPTCVQITYSPDFNDSVREAWAGIYWQYPSNNWGNMPLGRNMTGAKNLTFWARGERGGELAEFKVGGIPGRYPDSIDIPITTGVIVLSKNWTAYTVDLSGQNLSHIIGGFCWVTNENQNPLGSTIYLDDMTYVW